MRSKRHATRVDVVLSAIVRMGGNGPCLMRDHISPGCHHSTQLSARPVISSRRNIEKMAGNDPFDIFRTDGWASRLGKQTITS
jgi:hypothetical protein